MVRKKFSFAYEARSLIYLVQARMPLNGKGAQASYGEAIAHAVANVDEKVFSAGKTLDWLKVSQVELPDTIYSPSDTAAKRYRTHISLDEDTYLWLERQRSVMAGWYPSIVRCVYMPFVIRQVLRADYLIEAGRADEIVR